MKSFPRWSAREWTSVAGTRMHAALAGSRHAGSPGTSGSREVVLVGGLGCSHRYYRRLAGELAAHARVAAVDLPGFGLSPPREDGPGVRALSSALAEWLRCTGRTGSVLVGHSAGCHVVADLALHAPDVMGPVVLVSPVIDGPRQPWPRHVIRLAQDIVLDEPRMAVTWATVIVDVLGSGPVRVIRQFARLLRSPVSLTARSLPVPTVVVRGGRDRVSPPYLVRDIVGAAPDAQPVEVAGAGHLVHWTHARDVADEVVPLLAR